MKKFFIVLTILMMPLVAFARFAGPSNILTVAEARELRDDTPVILEGRIIKRVGDERYQFADDSGVIVVEIDDDEWRGMTVSEENRVRIYGEVDRGSFRRTRIDVERIEIIN